MAYREYKELVDMIEKFENMYKKEDDTRVFWGKWELNPKWRNYHPLVSLS